MDAQHKDRKIFLIGFMGSGKTTISRSLSRKCAMPWTDTDQEIVRRTGRTINDIFAEDGESAFRQLETQVLSQIAQEPGDLIISCGGGIALKDENVRIMRTYGDVVYLSATPETIFERVRYSTNRPLLNGHMEIGYISDLMDKRLPYYRAAATLTVDVDGREIYQIAGEIRSKLSLPGGRVPRGDA